jgi:hypothetical protein
MSVIEWPHLVQVHFNLMIYRETVTLVVVSAS